MYLKTSCSPAQGPSTTGVHAIVNDLWVEVSIFTLRAETNQRANLFCTLDFSSWHPPVWKHNCLRGRTKCHFQIKTCPCLLWNKVCMTQWAIRASGSQTYSCTGGWQKHSLQCYCTDLTCQLLAGANVRSNQSPHIFTPHFDMKKCDVTDQGNINCFSRLDVQWEMEMGWVTN